MTNFEERPIITQARYIKLLDGDIYEAILLQQAIYWTSDKRGHLKPDGYYWFYKKAEDWQAELCDVLSVGRIRRKLRHLEKIGILMTTSKFNKLPFDRTKWYTVNLEKLAQMLAEQKQSHASGKNDRIEVDETTTCTTTGNEEKANVDSVHIELDKTSTSEQDESSTSELDKTSTPITKDYAKTTAEITHHPKVHLADGDDEDVRKQQVKATAKEVIAYLNQKTGRSFRVGDKTLALVSARLREKYTLADFKQVIDNKFAKWGNDEHWSTFLRPQTLFAKSHFDNYLNETPIKQQQKQPVEDFNQLTDEEERSILNASTVSDDQLPF